MARKRKVFSSFSKKIGKKLKDIIKMEGKNQS
jgi:hypothetical protein